jgi:hypothetical protein
MALRQLIQQVLVEDWVDRGQAQGGPEGMSLVPKGWDMCDLFCIRANVAVGMGTYHDVGLWSTRGARLCVFEPVNLWNP